MDALQFPEAPSSHFAERCVQLTGNALLGIVACAVLLLGARQPLVHIAVHHLQTAVHRFGQVEGAHLIQFLTSVVSPADQSVHLVRVGGSRIEFDDTWHGSFDLIQEHVAKRVDIADCECGGGEKRSVRMQ